MQRVEGRYDVPYTIIIITQRRMVLLVSPAVQCLQQHPEDFATQQHSQTHHFNVIFTAIQMDVLHFMKFRLIFSYTCAVSKMCKRHSNIQLSTVGENQQKKSVNVKACRNSFELLLSLKCTFKTPLKIVFLNEASCPSLV